MSISRHLLLLLGLPALILIGGGAILVYPAWQEHRRLTDEIADLNSRMEGLSDRTEVVQSLAKRLADTRQIIDEDLKRIAADPGIAEIMSKLSMRTDGRRVKDQRFTRGSARDALDESDTLRAMALTVEMEATFDSIFATIRAAESMDRLVRITGVEVEVPGEEQQELDAPLLSAAVSLDSIYDPVPEEAR